MLLGCLDSKAHLLADPVCEVFWFTFCLFEFLLVFRFCFFFFNEENLYEVKSLIAVIHVFAECFWIYIWILVHVSNVYYNVRWSSSKVALYVLAGEVPKQVKVKKLKNLKTLDSKPGNNFRVKWTVFSF